MAKKNFYAVRKGRKTGIYNSWSECETQVKGYKNAEFAGFSEKKEAEAYLGLESVQAIDDSAVLPSENEIFAYVDGSFNSKKNIFGYGIVLIMPDGTVKELNGTGDDESAASMRNVAGELKGAFIAMQYAVNNRYNALTVFHDYEGIAKWAEHKWKANLVQTRAYVEFCDKIRQKIVLKFVKVDAHTGVLYNEKADILAKKAVGIADGED